MIYLEKYRNTKNTIPHLRKRGLTIVKKNKNNYSLSKKDYNYVQLQINFGGIYYA